MQERKRYTLEEKRQHVAAWRSSGLTRQQYSELHDIKFSTFREWPQDIKTRVSNDSSVSDVMVFPLLHGGFQFRHDGYNSINAEKGELPCRECRYGEVIFTGIFSVSAPF